MTTYYFPEMSAYYFPENIELKTKKVILNGNTYDTTVGMLKVRVLRNNLNIFVGAELKTNLVYEQFISNKDDTAIEKLRDIIINNSVPHLNTVKIEGILSDLNKIIEDRGLKLDVISQELQVVQQHLKILLHDTVICFTSKNFPDNPKILIDLTEFPSTILDVDAKIQAINYFLDFFRKYEIV